MYQNRAIVLAVTVGLCNCFLVDFGFNDLFFKEETRCYGELGCLKITKDWHHLIYRPLNFFPLPREDIDTKFFLYTRRNPLKGQIMRASKVDETIQKSNFDPKKQTKFIVHGFIDSPLTGWVKEMYLELLKHSDWNVIVVDWSEGSHTLYNQATANTRLVGLEIAYFINHLKDKYGLKPKDVHIIGHSLGAHIAGYAGERVTGLGHITGLDPAKPNFQRMPLQVRLDPTDAQLVDVIHTDGPSSLLLGFGMSEPCGHVDFYPNNGNNQPGCDVSDTLNSWLTSIKGVAGEKLNDLVACNHLRAIKLFTESINSHCPYVAHRCSSYQHFLQGRCFSCRENPTGCAVMGLNVRKPKHAPANSKYFFMTGEKEPFCMTVNLANPPKAQSWIQGFMKFTLHSGNNIIRNLNLTPSGFVKFQHGTSRSFVITHTDSIGPVRKVDLYWEADMNELQPHFIYNNNLYVSTIEVEETKVISGIDQMATEVSSKLCLSGRDYSEIPSRGTTFVIDNCTPASLVLEDISSLPQIAPSSQTSPVKHLS